MFFLSILVFMAKTEASSWLKQEQIPADGLRKSTCSFFSISQEQDFISLFYISNKQILI